MTIPNHILPPARRRSEDDETRPNRPAAIIARYTGVDEQPARSAAEEKRDYFADLAEARKRELVGAQLRVQALEATLARVLELAETPVGDFGAATELLKQIGEAAQ